MTVDAYDRTKFSVQKLVIMPKAWALYFMEPQFPWRALHMFKALMGTIPDKLKDSFYFIGWWIRLDYEHEVKKDESMVKAKCQNPHVDRRIL